VIVLEDLQEQDSPAGILARACSTLEELYEHLDILLINEPSHPHYIELLLLKTDIERTL
jgi:hypothetical protein